jgi:hypothetical protein
MQLCLRIHCFDGLRKAAQTIGDRNQNVLQAAVLQFVKDLESELGTFGLFDPQAQHFLPAAGFDA